MPKWGSALSTVLAIIGFVSIFTVICLVEAGTIDQNPPAGMEETTLIGAPLISCPSGEKRDVNGVCRKVE